MKTKLTKMIVTSFALASALVCLATSATAESGGRLVGVFDTHLTLTNCHGVVIRTLEALQMFNQGGTLASTDNQPPSSRGPGFGTWENMGGRSYSAPFQFFASTPTAPLLEPSRSPEISCSLRMRIAIPPPSASRSWTRMATSLPRSAAPKSQRGCSIDQSMEESRGSADLFRRAP